MNIGAQLCLAIALSMDAAAVSICLGLGLKKVGLGQMMTVGLWFGLFQGMMPLLGYYLGTSLSAYLSILDHWLSFFFLALVGIKMLLGDEYGEVEVSLGVKEMLPLALATSIDAFAIGLGFALLPQIDMGETALTIGISTFFISAIALFLGRGLGSGYSHKAEKVGGSLLLVMAVHVLGEGLGFWL